MFGVDNVTVFTWVNDGKNNTATWPFNSAFHPIFNIAVAGDFGGYCLKGITPSFPNNGVTNVMRVDYIRWYSQVGAKATPAPTPRRFGANSDGDSVRAAADTESSSAGPVVVGALLGVGVLGVAATLLAKRRRAQQPTGTMTHPALHSAQALEVPTIPHDFRVCAE